jgi:chorismate mutase
MMHFAPPFIFYNHFVHLQRVLPMNDLDIWRIKIDEIDRQLVQLLNERAGYATEIGKIKLALGLDAYSPRREEEVMNNVTAHNRGPLSTQAIRRLFERIIDESRSIERIFMHDHQKPKTL